MAPRQSGREAPLFALMQLRFSSRFRLLTLQTRRGCGVTLCFGGDERRSAERCSNYLLRGLAQRAIVRLPRCQLDLQVGAMTSFTLPHPQAMMATVQGGSDLMFGVTRTRLEMGSGEACLGSFPFLKLFFHPFVFSFSSINRTVGFLWNFLLCLMQLKSPFLHPLPCSCVSPLFRSRFFVQLLWNHPFSDIITGNEVLWLSIVLLFTIFFPFVWWTWDNSSLCVCFWVFGGFSFKLGVGNVRFPVRIMVGRA